jgi:hypothetical protein
MPHLHPLLETGSRAAPNSLLVAVFETSLRFGIGTAHGSRPTYRTATVTRSAGHEVQELDGAPAARGLDRLLTLPEAELAEKHLTLATGAVFGTTDPFDQHSIHVISYATATGALIY